MGTDKLRRRLSAEADRFAVRLTKLLNNTTTRGVQVKAIVTHNGRQATVAPVPADLRRTPDKRIGYAPLAVTQSNEASLGLQCSFRVSMDDEGAYMRVNQSQFALVVDQDSGLSPIRVEYDRRKTSKQQSHVQILGESASLGYAFALAGSPNRPLSKLHLPTGGRRFRPTLEDFIEFLAQEKLLPMVHPTWKAAIAESRAGWEERQTRAAVRRMPDAAIRELKALGHSVQEPPSPDPGLEPDARG